MRGPPVPQRFREPAHRRVTATGWAAMFKLMVDELDRFFSGNQTQFDLTPRSLTNRRGSDAPVT